MDSESLYNGLVLFLSWLQCVGNCILIGHNFKKSDLPRLFVIGFQTLRLMITVILIIIFFFNLTLKGYLMSNTSI